MLTVVLSFLPRFAAKCSASLMSRASLGFSGPRSLRTFTWVLLWSTAPTTGYGVYEGVLPGMHGLARGHPQPTTSPPSHAGVNAATVGQPTTRCCVLLCGVAAA